MTAINRSLKALFTFLLVALSSGLTAGVTYYDLKAPGTALTNPEIAQGGILLLKVDTVSALSFNDKPVFVDSKGLALIALSRDATSAKLSWLSADNTQRTTNITVIKRDFAIERIDGLPPAKVTAPPDPAIQQRIRNEAIAVRQARTLTEARADFLEKFIWPVEGRISGYYGSQRILNGIPKTPHYGVDVAVPTGTPVVAPASGKIIYANQDMYYSGGTLVIDHGHGLSSTFLHLSELLAAPGDVVKQGQVVAKVGATGRATGPHLDWRMNLGPGTRIDPELIVAPMKK